MYSTCTVRDNDTATKQICKLENDNSPYCNGYCTIASQSDLLAVGPQKHGEHSPTPNIFRDNSM